ncbi:hypothetical protein CYL20_11630 [Pseudomonas palleroniana]|uniref:Uncharacterized protein n=1 Tax=Pseudomonas palleroniana TaxID=191390 RepID=A0A2L1J9I5_9PSED|nr:hypothetical protein [Pseudomonas palleroniana]AVE05163.1 hypothetical protein CYL20_11630 [Pseudomonas palleroniana]
MAHHPLREKVIEQFVKSWSRAQPASATLAVEVLTALYDKFRDAGLADRIFEQQLTSGQRFTYAQRVGELLLADMLWRDGFSLESRNEGPDFLATKDGKSAWIELQTPEPAGIPKDYLAKSCTGQVQSVPHAAINLRWTAAVAEKTKKLWGYLESGMVKADQPYIIAVNTRLLNPYAMTGLYGVSGKPVAVEVLFSVGPIQIQIDRSSGDIVDQFHQHRPVLDKPGTENKVPSDTFLNEQNACISAVLGLDLLEQVTLGGQHPSAIVYNPLAVNPITQRWIEAQEHWHCTIGAEEYVVQKLET